MNQKDVTKDYYVINENGVVIFEDDDLFLNLDKIKSVGKPNYKLLRRSDKKTLSYTTQPKFDLTPEFTGKSKR